MPTTPLVTYNSPSTTRLDPWYNAEDAEEQVVKLADAVYARGTVLGEKIGVSDVQVITPSATGGSFKIIVPTTPLAAGATTAPITASASLPTASTVEEALELLPCIGEGNVAVTGSAGGPFSIAFQNQLADIDIELTTDASLLTGGAGTAAVTTGTEGDPGTAGTFAPYDPEATDGTQHAKCILRYACSVSGGVVSNVSDWGPQNVNAMSAFMRGYFRTEQLVGLDAGALTDLGATIVQGTLLSGVVRIG